MAVSISIDGRARGADYQSDELDYIVIHGTINAGSSYATGGVTGVEAALLTALQAAYSGSNFSSLDRMLIGPSDGLPPNKIEAAYLPGTDALRCSYAAPVLTNTEETGLTPSSHVVTPAGTPFAWLSARITAGTATGVVNLARAFTPATSLDGSVACVDCTLTLLAADAATDVDCCFLEYTAMAEVPNATDLSNANFTMPFLAVCEK